MNCTHENRKDLTQGLGSVRHWFCPDCKWHKYKGKEYTKKEWEIYIIKGDK